MSNNYASGGHNRCDFFRFRKNAGGTAYEFLNKLTGTAAPTPTIATDRALLYNLIEGTKPSPQDDGSMKVSWSSIQFNKELWDFLDVAAVPASTTSGVLPEKKLEDGVKVNTAGVSSSELVVAVMYLSDWNDGTNDYTFVLVAMGGMSATSGAFETKSDDYNYVAMDFVSQKAEFALTLPAGIFDTTALLDATSLAATITSIPVGKHFVRKFVKKHP